MPLFYYARQSQIATKEGVKTWHLSLKKVGKVVDTQLLAESIAEKSSLTPGDVQNVIRNLMSTMRMHLLNSRTVRLNGLGTFTMKARTRGKGTETRIKLRRCVASLPRNIRVRRLLVLLALCCRAWSLKNGWKQPLMVELPAVANRMAERKKIRWDEKSYDLSSNNLKFRDNEYKSISLG